MPQQSSRQWLSIAVFIMLTLVLLYAIWPQPMPVDVAKLRYAPMTLTIDEEGRTRVKDAYMVAAPVAGRLLRVERQPGDKVTAQQTVLARLLPLSPALLDIRTREQASAAIAAAEAALRMAKADLNKARAESEFADAQLTRATSVFARGLSTESERDLAARAARSARADVDTATAAISVREAEVDAARARLLEIRDTPDIRSTTQSAPVIPLVAPVSGKILQILQRSETTVTAGTPIIEIGDTDTDLEILVELLSTDAVKVAPGNRVIIDNWGGETALDGYVERVEPWGFTKYSALGVEEQRVNTIIRLNENARQHHLGHGYRVEARIVVWEDDDVLIAPSSALFRYQEGWAVFVKQQHQALLTAVKVGYNNGLQAQILQGLEAGQEVILYPGPELQDGAQVTQRAP